MTKKELMRAMAFFLVVCMMIVVLCDLFEQENSTNYDKSYYTLRNQEKNTLDGIYIGTSGVDRYWIGAKAYEEYGMTVYALGFDAMASWMVPYVIEDVLSNQSPELILLDTRPFTQENIPEEADARSRRVLDAMSLFSPNRIRAACKTMEVMHTLDESRPEFDLSYIVPFIKYHSKWSMDYRFDTNLGYRAHNFQGFFMLNDLTVLSKEQNPVPYDAQSSAELDPISEKALYDLLDYIEEKNLNVLFVDTPQFFEGEEMKRSNRVYQILEENGFEYINFYSEDSANGFTIDLDPKRDFYNSGHVNYYGAEKFTDALSAYLDTHYDLPDRRNDPAAQVGWDGVYQRLCDTIQEYELLQKQAEESSISE